MDPILILFISYVPFLTFSLSQMVRPVVTGDPRQRNLLPGHHIFVHTPGGVIGGYKHLAKPPLPPVLQLLFEICMQPCVTVAKDPCTSTRLMWLYSTERRPNHSLMYTVDHTFGYHSQKFIHTCAKLSAHAHSTEIRGRKFKQFKTAVGLTR